MEKRNPANVSGGISSIDNLINTQELDHNKVTNKAWRMALFRWEIDIAALLFSTRSKNAYLTPPGFYPIRCYAFAFATLGPALRTNDRSGTLDAQGGKRIVPFPSPFTTEDEKYSS